MITIFSTAKPFSGLVATIQRNAISSWAYLGPEVEVVLLGDELGVKGISEDLGLKHVTHLERGKNNLPLIKSLFGAAEEAASNDLLCYVNCDIVLTPDFVETVKKLLAFKKKLLVVGKKKEVYVTGELDFSTSSSFSEIKDLAFREGKDSYHGAIDYFVFPKGLFPRIPDFTIGCIRYDNWLVEKAISSGALVIDASDFITAIHLNTSPSEFDGKYSLSRLSPGDLENLRIYDSNVLFSGGSGIEDSTHILTSTGLKRRVRPPKDWVRKNLLFLSLRAPFLKIPCWLMYLALRPIYQFTTFRKKTG